MQIKSETLNEENLLEKFDKETIIRHPISPFAKTVIAGVAIFYALYHLVTTFFPLPQLLYRSAHVSIGLALIFLLYPSCSKQNRNRIPFYDYFFVLCSLASFAYLWFQYDAIMNSRGGIYNTVDVIFAVMTVILVIDAARRVMGWALPILAMLFLIYPFISHYNFMPNRLLTRPYDLSDIFGQMYLKTEGIFSTAIGASVSFIFLFILFGAFLAKSGMGKLFNDLALALAGSKQGGPAKVAVISSGFMGSINGSAVGNVVGTGVFTIPMMKKVGYNANFSGAVEASASVGGQLLPPIMGASAFIMAETTGVKYSTIVICALLPAFLYYLGVIAQVHFRAGKDNLKGIPKCDLPRIRDVLMARGHLLIPIIVLVMMLINSVPINLAAFYTILISIVVSQFRHETRMSLKDIIDALISGSKQSLPVMAACAVVGIVIGTISLTGFASVMISMITTIGENSLFVTLFLTMLASMVLGMGLPSIPAYIITATMAAPAIANLGVPVISAHLFVFYFGLFANITPPVALASFAGAGIAGGDPMKTGWQSLKLASAGFIVPFMFVYNPEMLYIDPTGLSVNATEFPAPQIVSFILICITSAIGVVALGSAIEGYFKSNLNIIMRILLAIGALLLIIPEVTTDIIGVIMVCIVIILDSKKTFLKT